MRAVHVVGGGPAGVMVAFAAMREGAGVRIFEKSAFPRHKVCGEFLSPAILPLLRRAGCEAGFLQLRPSILSAMRLHFGTRVIRHPPPEPAYGLSRYELDRLLLEHAASAGAQVVREHCSVACGCGSAGGQQRGPPFALRSVAIRRLTISHPNSARRAFFAAGASGMIATHLSEARIWIHAGRLLPLLRVEPLQILLQQDSHLPAGPVLFPFQRELLTFAPRLDERQRDRNDQPVHPEFGANTRTLGRAEIGRDAIDEGLMRQWSHRHSLFQSLPACERLDLATGEAETNRVFVDAEFHVSE